MPRRLGTLIGVNDFPQLLNAHQACLLALTFKAAHQIHDKPPPNTLLQAIHTPPDPLNRTYLNFNSHRRAETTTTFQSEGNL
jgi:hypothetical protein